MKIAFIGLGIMGKPMALNLIKAGHQLRVYDRNAATIAELKAAGATACSCSAETVEGVDLVLTMLPNSPHVKSVMLEDDKLAEKMPKTAAFIDMSSINPVASREIAAELAKYGIDMLDAPVSGGQPKAIDGTLSFMVGGKEEVFNKFKPVLEAMGSSVVLCGDVGAGDQAVQPDHRGGEHRRAGRGAADGPDVRRGAPEDLRGHQGRPGRLHRHERQGAHDDGSELPARLPH